MHGFMRRFSAALLILAVAFVGINATPASLPRGHAQQVSIAGTILGLAAIAGIVYLITQDQQGVYHRYRYQGPYAAYYHNYQGRYYNGPLPGQWSGNQGRMNWNEYHRGWTARCAPRADNRGRWGQQRQWDAWCQQNQRFRGGRPDAGWRRNNPWDRGMPNDGPGH
jgi:hypothetical protein